MGGMRGGNTYPHGSADGGIFDSGDVTSEPIKRGIFRGLSLTWFLDLCTALFAATVFDLPFLARADGWYPLVASAGVTLFLLLPLLIYREIEPAKIPERM